jgi:2-dehydropantoate 2-reductase
LRLAHLITEKQAMHFIILGAGAIGCYVGARLASAGQQVTLVGRPRVLQPLTRDGLQVSDLDGFSAQVPPASLRLAQSLAEVNLQPPCVVLLCVKGGATESAAHELAAACAAGTPVISLQNGVDNVARLQAAAPQLQVLAGMVPYNVVMPKANAVHRATTGSLHLQRSAISEQVAPLFAAAGLPTELVDDMRAVQWGKLLLNLNNPVNALSDLPLRDQLMDRGYRRVLAALQTEALRALDAAGILPSKVGGAPPRLLPRILRLPNGLFKLVAARMLRIDPSARSSMWDDLQLGRGTEIDDLCGAVVRLARQHGTNAPRNETMCALVTQHRKGERLGSAQMCQALGL